MTNPVIEALPLGAKFRIEGDWLPNVYTRVDYVEDWFGEQQRIIAEAPSILAGLENNVTIPYAEGNFEKDEEIVLVANE